MSMTELIDTPCYSRRSQGRKSANAKTSYYSDYRDHSWDRIRTSLAKIRDLKDGWDGDEGQAPDPDLVEKAKCLAQQWQAQGGVVPDRVLITESQTILFEWQHSNIYREFEILGPSTAEDRTLDKATGKTQVEVFSL